MARIYGSVRDLWQSITGSSILRPTELAGEEIKRNHKRLLAGLDYYCGPKSDDGKKLKAERKVEKIQLDFVLKISKFLALDEFQSHDLLCLYLLHDYRGSQKELQSVLGEDRHSQILLLKVRDYYYSERLYLLRCIKHLLSNWQEESHPYREPYAEFVDQAVENEWLIKKIKKQYEAVCASAAPSWQTRGSAMNERQAAVWMQQNLREQCELLEIILLYYKDFEHPGDQLAELAIKFRKQGFGIRQTNKHLLEDSSEKLLHRIGFLQVLILIEGVDLEYMYKCYETDSLSKHQVLKPKTLQDIDAVMSCLGDSPQHGPVVLTWAVVKHLAKSDDSATAVRKLGNAALQLRVFSYLCNMLDTEPFNGETTVATVCQVVTYGLLCITLSIFHEDTLGDTEELYDLASRLLKKAVISEDFWLKGEEEGLGMLLQSARSRFPLFFPPLLQISTALSSASRSSCYKVQQMLDQLSTYTEYLDRNHARDIESTGDEFVWRLIRDKRPYNAGPSFVIPAGCLGQLHVQEKSSPVVQWECTYSGWQLFHCETQTLLEQISHGAGMVMAETAQRVQGIAKLLTATVKTDPNMVKHTGGITDCLYLVIHRFCVLTRPPLELISCCMDTLACLAKLQPLKVWHNLQQTGLLPYLTENLDDLTEYTSGAGLNAGAYGTILAGYECSQGNYPLTCATLQLLSNLIQPMHAADREKELTACILFVSREIFPVFHKWRYFDFSKREQLGQRCLEIFHKILILEQDKRPKKGVSLRDICVFSLLFTESGRALLDIISTGVDSIEAALGQQGSAVEGMGVELIQLIRLAFSVLNRLLLLRPVNKPPSPVEHCLSAQPANRANRHLVATIAQYIYHRHDPRLPTLSTLLLKRLATVFPMSILACLGNEALALRDVYLARLQAFTEDIRLKVVILEFLAVCVDTQPGLTEMFLNVQPADKQGKKDLSLGRVSCLQTVLDLMEEKKQGTYHCPSDLLCAALGFLHALWCGHRMTAMSVLREKPTFWRSVCWSLMRSLPHLKEEESDWLVLSREVKTCANIFRILALELYGVGNSQLDKNLKKVLDEVIKEKRMQYWSKYLRDLMEHTATSETDTDRDLLTEHCTLQFLIAWRNITLVLTSSRGEAMTLTGEAKAKLMSDIIDGLQAQFTDNMGPLQNKLASVSSALYFTLLKHWKGHIKDWTGSIKKVSTILMQSCANSVMLMPHVQIGILGSLTVLLQHIRANRVKVDISVIRSLFGIVCDVLQQSTYQLTAPAAPASPNTTPPVDNTLDAKLKLQITTVCLLEELILTEDNSEVWLPTLQQHTILPCLLQSLQAWMAAKAGIQYVEAVLLLFLTLSKIPQSAEALAVNGLTQETCLVLVSMYSGDTSVNPQATPQKPQSGKERQEVLTWRSIYRLSICLMASMLDTLRFSFLEDALNFVGAHQDQMQSCLDCVHADLRTASLLEAEQTCSFVYQLSHYGHQWRLYLPQVMVNLLTCVCQLSETCVSLLIRPRLLQHVLQNHTGKDGNQPVVQSKLSMTPIAQRLSQQSSMDEVDLPSEELQQGQCRLLQILSLCLATMRQFSPDLCEILLDQSMDVTEYEALLRIGFSTPSVDQDVFPTFGTMVSCTNMCIRLLSKIDPKAASPMKSPVGGDNMPIKRSLVMYVLENALHLIMSQASRYLRQPDLSSREKQLLKRELSAELNSFLLSMQRYLRRGPTSPAPGSNVLISPSTSGVNKSQLQPSFTAGQDTDFFRLVDDFVRHVLR